MDIKEKKKEKKDLKISKYLNEVTLQIEILLSGIKHTENCLGTTFIFFS